MNYLSVCSGIEAATVAWHPLGWNPVGFSEIEPFPSQVLKHHYPTVPNLGDMTKFKEWEIESNIDVFVGGTPCQSFSVAGLRKGLDDPRGNLMLTYLAIADKFRPRWLVWENVPGVLSSNGGKDFATFLGGLGELGYGFAYRILDAQYFGVAQRRRRVFVVGYLGDWRCAAAVLFERHSLQGNPAPSRNSWEKIAGTVTARFGNSRNNQEELAPLQYLDNAECKNIDRVAARMVSFGEYSVDGTASSMKARDYKDATDLVAQPVGTDLYNGTITGDIACTFTADATSATHSDPTVMQSMAVRRLTPVECERLQGFPDHYTDIKSKGKQTPDGPRYKALGNSMAVPVMNWIGQKIQKVEEIIKL
jgi:DNA (cytosine-5)-methyltransferase 1